MKFPYKLIPLSHKSPIFGHSILRPIIPIKLFGDTISFQYEVLLDSGADVCIFDGEIGEALGIDVTSGSIERFGGVQETQAAIAYFHHITVEVGGKKITIPTLFSYDIASSGYGILGQKGFFEQHKILFEYSKKNVELKLG